MKLTRTRVQPSALLRWVHPLALLLLVLSTVVGQGVPSASAAPVKNPLPPQVNALLAKANARGSVRVIVGVNANYTPEGSLPDQGVVTNQRQGIAQAQQGVLDRVAKTNARLQARFEFIPYMAFSTDEAGLQALAADPAITDIQEDTLAAPSLEDSVPLIGGSPTGTFGTTNRTGAGQTVAILDSGVMKTHSFLTGKVVSEACYSTTDATQGSTAFCTPGSTAAGSGVNCPSSVAGCDHGTHVAGIVAGKGANGITFNGVAKDATLIAIQVFSKFSGANCGGAGECPLSYTSDQIKALERVYALRTTYKIAAVNMSLGGGGPFNTHCDDTRAAQKAAIDNLLAVGIATIIASGNESFTNGVASPACISTAVTVGSTTKWDTVSSFSNSGNPVDLLAPGSDIYASVSSSTTSFGYKSGTSMATPHVAGAWAVMKQQSPTANVALVQTTLQNTGVAILDTRNNLSRKRIALSAAVNAMPTANPVPTTTSFSPASAVAGSPAIQLTVNGTNFVAGSIVRWKGANRTTTFVSATQLKATLTAADLAVPGTAAVTVFNPAPGGGTSAARNFTIVSACNNYEPNNTHATALVMGMGTTQTHAFCTANDQDWIKFSTSAAYQYTIDTSMLGAGVNTVLSLYNAAGAVVVPETSDAASPATSAITFIPAAGGVYYVKVRNRTTAAGASYIYNLRLTSVLRPVITSLSPSTILSGGPSFQLTVNGKNFVPGSIVRWKGSNRVTTFVSATQLKANIAAADRVAVGAAAVTVYRPASATTLAVTSLPVNFTVTTACNNYEPNNMQATALVMPVGATQTHAFCTANDQDWSKFSTSAAYQYTIDTSTLGAGVNTVLSIYNAAGAVIVPETSDAASPATSSITFVPPLSGVYYIKARNRTTAAGASYIYNLRLTSVLRPRITSFSPATVEAGSPAFSLTVNGANFVAGSVVRWKGANRTTTFVSATQLKATITKADIADGGAAAITIYNPATTTAAAVLSAPVNFTVTAPTAPKPTITALVPTSRAAGTAAFVLVVKGTNFVPRSVVRWNNSPRVTTYVNATELRASITAADIAAAGNRSITVVTAAPGGGTSATLNFVVTAPPTPCNLDEPNNTIATAKQFTPFGSSRVYGFCAAGDADYIWISAAANTKYQIQILNSHADIDAVVTAYNPDQSLIGSVDQYGMGMGEDVILTTDAAGKYYIKFHDYWDSYGPNNTYTVKVFVVTGLTGNVSGPAAFEPVKPGIEKTK